MQQNLNQEVTSAPEQWSFPFWTRPCRAKRENVTVYHAVGRLTDGALFSCCISLQFRLVICEHHVGPAQVSTVLPAFWSVLQWRRWAPSACCPDQKGFRCRVPACQHRDTSHVQWLQVEEIQKNKIKSLFANKCILESTMEYEYVIFF